MKKYMRIFTMILSIMIMATGCMPSEDSYKADSRDEMWINDISYIEEKLPKVHKDLYFDITPKEFQSQMNDLKTKVSSYSDEEIQIELSKIIASVGDTHTGFSISSELVYPFELHWFDEGIYIMNTVKEYEELLYGKIITIDGKKIEAVAESIKPMLKGANESWFKTQIVYYLSMPNVLKYFDIVKDDNIELSILLGNGEIKNIELSPMNYKDIVPIDIPENDKILYKLYPNQNYWYKYLEDEKLLYINYRSCRQMREKPFQIFSKEIWEFIDKNEVEKLVLDIRENRGGRSPILNPFIDDLKNSEFNDKNKLYVIIGKDTYSSAILNAIDLKKNTNAYFVGEETGGNPNHYGEVEEFQLPNHKDYSVRYSTKYFNWNTESSDTLKPDKVIKESFESFINSKDPVLEWIKSK